MYHSGKVAYNYLTFPICCVQYDNWLEGNNWQVCYHSGKVAYNYLAFPICGVQYDNWLEGSKLAGMYHSGKVTYNWGFSKNIIFNQTRTVAYFNVVVVGGIGFSPYADCLNRKY